MFFKQNFTWFSVLILLVGLPLHAQESGLREKTFETTSNEIVLDSLLIFPNSLNVFCDGDLVKKSDYIFSSSDSKIIFNEKNYYL